MKSGRLQFERYSGARRSPVSPDFGRNAPGFFFCRYYQIDLADIETKRRLRLALGAVLPGKEIYP